MKSFFELFTTEFKNMYSSENQIIAALPEMIEAASDLQLKEVLSEHLEETKNQAGRLEEIADELKIELTNAQSPVMAALLKDGHKFVVSQYPAEVKDSAIIAAAQCVEHYEIAVYGCLRSFAHILDLDRAEKLFKKTLNEESNANKKLNEIAEGTLFVKGVNKKASDRVSA